MANRSRQIKEEDFSGPRTVQSAMRWLDDNQKSDNWFLQLELFDPHEPFYCPKKYRDLYNDTWDGPLFDWPNYNIVKESPEAVEHIRKCYAALLTMTDHWCGRLFKKLEELNLWDDTLIVFTTDHGTMLGEREYWMKNFMPVYPEIGNIPLVIKPPRMRKRARIDALTQTTDVMPTFLDFFNCPLPPHVSGRSLRPLMEKASEEWREDIIFGYFGMAVNITDGRHLYMRNPVRDDGGPLHAYTAMPVQGLNQLVSARAPWSMESAWKWAAISATPTTFPSTKFRMKQAKFPRSRSHGQPSFIGRHELYTLPCLPESTAISDPKLEAHFARRIVEHLRQRLRRAAPEHLARAGFDRISHNDATFATGRQDSNWRMSHPRWWPGQLVVPLPIAQEVTRKYRVQLFAMRSS